MSLDNEETFEVEKHKETPTLTSGRFPDFINNNGLNENE